MRLTTKNSASSVDGVTLGEFEVSSLMPERASLCKLNGAICSMHDKDWVEEAEWPSSYAERVEVTLKIWAHLSSPRRMVFNSGQRCIG